jgi:para-nitrobenzyl esterase
LLAELAIDRDQAAAILSVPATEIVSATVRMARKRGRFSSVIPPLRPVQTQDLPWKTAQQALSSCARDDLDVLLGYTSDEMRAFFDTDFAVSQASTSDVVAELSRRYGDGSEVFSRFRSSPEVTPGRVLGAAIGESDFASSAKQVATSRARKPRPAFVYEFGWGNGRFGACHCVDLPFFFGNQTAWADAPMLDSVSRVEFDELSRSFRDSVGQFVHFGSPGWQPFTDQHEVIKIFK